MLNAKLQDLKSAHLKLETADTLNSDLKKKILMK